MRKTAFTAAMTLCAVFFVTAPAQAMSQTTLALGANNIFGDGSIAPINSVGSVATLTPDSTQESEEQAEDTKAKPAKKKSKKPTKHTVEAGDSLSKIAKKYDTTWPRLYAKNEQLDNPDILTVGQKLSIPKPSEELELRELPVPEPIAPAPTPATSAPVSTQPAASAPVVRPATTAGNTYYAGYCTWYAKSRRPDLPNNLGNAITWASRAAAQGIPTGSTPRVGAIAQSGNHVAYVESVNGDGTVTVSEMNWKGWNITSTRTAPASSFTYIY